MKPTVPELLRGVADALEADTVTKIDDIAARNQVQAAIGILRRSAALIPLLHSHLFADADDMAETLRYIAFGRTIEERQEMGAAVAALEDLDARTCTLDQLQAAHQGLLAIVDRVVAQRGSRGDATNSALAELAARMAKRERMLGASIAGR